ncbi:helix-turn-helix domain-containing protein [Actinoallomurus iriomotensis]|uniref:Cyclic diguanylate phosphodiesterase n=1 Tax=Actinoallomurus iriomotensis TaxID=478107 RepID=A0A9W6SEM5_9ACTN|nr:GAF domain-containing protein [Actinoallomurus iriomotensis]GLY92464.1 cyclic diguanylate phosphodiesterase [Actinoallomurus iriomotensis]
MNTRIFFELLAREAPAVDFETPIAEARAAGASPADLAELEQAKTAALRVRALLARRARREVELSALFETASDLAGLRDLDAVLNAIVRRARQLLGADVAYMTLNDPSRGDTYMRVTDGSISRAFQTLRLPLGSGLGGLVAQTGAPYASSGYLTDERFRHTGSIDGGVTEEGLVGILGVPMRLGERVIGVLFAADRAERSYAQEEVALLCSLAAHAAVAIDNARLLQETRVTLEELSAASEAARVRGDAVERAARAHDRMTDLVVRGGGVEDVASVVTDILGGSLVVLDADGRRLAEVGRVDRVDEDLITRARTLGRTARRGDLRVIPIGAGAEVLGTLALHAAGDIADADERILERAALVMALLLLFRRNMTEVEGRVRGELLDDLVAGHVSDPDALDARARRLGVDLGADHVLVVARHGGRRERAAFWASSFSAAEHGLSTAYSGEVVLLLPGHRPEEAAARVAKELGAALGLPVTAGAAGPVDLPGGADAARREARRCADALLALGREGDGASADGLGFVGLLIGEGGDTGAFVERTLGPVIAYDERRGTALTLTMAIYFGTGGSLARTAERLHIHTNTVTQRLERIGRLIGADWQRADRALQIQLALHLHRLRGSLPP